MVKVISFKGCFTTPLEHPRTTFTNRLWRDSFHLCVAERGDCSSTVDQGTRDAKTCVSIDVEKDTRTRAGWRYSIWTFVCKHWDGGKAGWQEEDTCSGTASTPGELSSGCPVCFVSRQFDVWEGTDTVEEVEDLPLLWWSISRECLETNQWEEVGGLLLELYGIRKVPIQWTAVDAHLFP